MRRRLSRQPSTRSNNSNASVRSEDLLRLINIPVPPSLAPVSPFLEEALHVLRRAGVSEQSCRLALACLEHAFALVASFSLDLDYRGTASLASFRRLMGNISDRLARVDAGGWDAEEEFRRLFDDAQASDSSVSSGSHSPPATPLGGPDESLGSTKERRTSPQRPAAFYGELLAAEASALLELAEREFALGLVDDAGRLFHTAAVYLRVSGPLLPPPCHSTEAEALGGGLRAAVRRARECASSGQNLVQEHFDAAFADSYEYTAREDAPLGRGSFGRVAACAHRRTGDAWACKLVRLRRLSVHQVHLLHSEIAIMKQLDHPNIVKLKEVFFEDQSVCLVMELCAGGDLASSLEEGCAMLADAETALLLRQMCGAVLHLHDRNIVHRDVKLGNFLFSGAPLASPLKLIDFGLARRVDEGEWLSSLAGTPYYIAPEVWGGRYDQRCDVWSLGVCAYIMLFGALPFEGDSAAAGGVAEVRRRVLTEDPAYLCCGRIQSTSDDSEAADAVEVEASAEATQLVRRLLAKDLDRRVSLEDAIQHPFLAGPAPATRHHHQQEQPLASTSLSREEEELAEAVGRYVCAPEATRLVLRLVASCLAPASPAALLHSSHFHNHSGRSRPGIAPQHTQQQQQCEPALPPLTLSYSEEVAALLWLRAPHTHIEETRLRAAFARLNPSGTGSVSAAAVRLFLDDTPPPTHTPVGGPEERAATVLRALDVNADGAVDEADFVSYWELHCAHGCGLPHGGGAAPAGGASVMASGSAVLQGGLRQLARLLLGTPNTAD